MASPLERYRLKKQGYQELVLGQSMSLIGQEVYRIFENEAPGRRISKMLMCAGVIVFWSEGGLAYFPETKTGLSSLPPEEWRERDFSADVESVSPEGKMEYYTISGSLFNRVGEWEVLRVGMFRMGLT